MESILLSDVSRDTRTPAVTTPPFLRRVAPGVAGFVIIAALSHAADALGSVGVFSVAGVPTTGPFMLATAHRSVFGATTL